MRVRSRLLLNEQHVVPVGIADERFLKLPRCPFPLRQRLAKRN
jgi:hypothetical protein